MAGLYKIYLWIDRYPDYSFYTITAVNVAVQLLLGVSFYFIILALALMFCNFIIVLVTNLLIKNLLRVGSPPRTIGFMEAD